MIVVVYNLGCKVNQYEGYGIATSLRLAGHTVYHKMVPADIYIINTCAVTAEAERKSRQMVAKCKKFNSQAKILFCGCAAQKFPQEFSEKGVDFVSGVAGKGELWKKLQSHGCEILPLPTQYEDNLEITQYRTRGYVKIQDGCNNFCSYCIVPYLRGRERSRLETTILQEVNALSTHCREIVLTGINISAYGKDTNTSLTQLLQHFSKNVRVRLGSLEVNVIDDAFLRACQELPEFCPHFHLSLQSGSDSVLKRMNRKYTMEMYKGKVRLIRRYFPYAAITTDIIAGFPMETQEEMEETEQNIAAIGFADAHIFPYSKRLGTKAAALPDLPYAVKKERSQRLSIITQRSQRMYIESLKGQNLSVLIEEKKNGFWIGHSKEFVKVYLPQNQKIAVGDIVLIECKDFDFYQDGIYIEKMEE